jgi:hypothetical protein
LFVVCVVFFVFFGAASVSLRGLRGSVVKGRG